MISKLKKIVEKGKLKNWVILLWIIFVYLNYYFRFFNAFLQLEAPDIIGFIEKMKGILGG